jgi:adenylate cyclase
VQQDIAAADGPERLREIMAELPDCSTAVVKRYGGTLSQFTGDGIMAVFGAPVTLEDHAFRACKAALDIQEDAGVTLKLRIGLNSGQVVAGEICSSTARYTTIGEQLGMAQRMESAAPPGGAMLSGSTTSWRFSALRQRWRTMPSARAVQPWRFRQRSRRSERRRSGATVSSSGCG